MNLLQIELEPTCNLIQNRCDPIKLENVITPLFGISEKWNDPPNCHSNY